MSVFALLLFFLFASKALALSGQCAQCVFHSKDFREFKTTITHAESWGGFKIHDLADRTSRLPYTDHVVRSAYRFANVVEFKMPRWWTAKSNSRDDNIFPLTTKAIAPALDSIYKIKDFNLVGDTFFYRDACQLPPRFGGRPVNPDYNDPIFPGVLYKRINDPWIEGFLPCTCAKSNDISRCIDTSLFKNTDMLLGYDPPVTRDNRLMGSSKCEDPTSSLGDYRKMCFRFSGNDDGKSNRTSYDLTQVFQDDNPLVGDKGDYCGLADPGWSDKDVLPKMQLKFTYSIKRVPFTNYLSLTIDIFYNNPDGTKGRVHTRVSSVSDLSSFSLPFGTGAVGRNAPQASLGREENRRLLFTFSEAYRYFPDEIAGFDNSYFTNDARFSTNSLQCQAIIPTCAEPCNNNNPLSLDCFYLTYAKRDFKCVIAMRQKVQPFYLLDRNGNPTTLRDPIDNNPYYSHYDTYCFADIGLKSLYSSEFNAKKERLGGVKEILPGYGNINCLNGGTLLLSGRCSCPPQYNGFDCSQAVPLAYQTAYYLAVADETPNWSTEPSCNTFSPCKGVGVCKDVYFICSKSALITTDIDALIAQKSKIIYSADRTCLYMYNDSSIQTIVHPRLMSLGTVGSYVLGRTIECTCYPGFIGAIKVTDALRENGFKLFTTDVNSKDRRYAQGILSDWAFVANAWGNTIDCQVGSGQNLDTFNNPGLELYAANHQCEFYNAPPGLANFSFASYEPSINGIPGAFSKGQPALPLVCNDSLLLPQNQNTGKTTREFLYGGSGCMICPNCAVHGTCVDVNPVDPFADGAPRHCQCDYNWGGPLCDKPECPIDPDNGLVCGGPRYGACNESLPNTNTSAPYLYQCTCNDGYSGLYCTVAACNMDGDGKICGGNGACYSSVCDSFWGVISTVNASLNRQTSSLSDINSAWRSWMLVNYNGHPDARKLKIDYDVTSGYFLNYSDVCIPNNSTAYAYRCLCDNDYVRSSAYGICVKSCPHWATQYFEEPYVAIPSRRLECNGLKISTSFGDVHTTGQTVCDRTAPDRPLCRCHMALTVDSFPDNKNHDLDGYYSGALGACGNRYRDKCVKTHNNRSTSDQLDVCSGHGRCIVCDSFTADSNCKIAGTDTGFPFSEDIPPKCHCSDGFKGIYCDQSTCRDDSDFTDPVNACNYWNMTTDSFVASTGDCKDACHNPDGSGGQIPCYFGISDSLRIINQGICVCSRDETRGIYYSGKNCQIASVGCINNATGPGISKEPCSGHGSPEVSEANGTCKCNCAVSKLDKTTIAYEGLFCQTSNLCPGCTQGQGDCKPVGSGEHQCICREFFSGANCTVNACTANGGTYNSSTPSAPFCVCPDGFTWQDDTKFSRTKGCRLLCPLSVAGDKDTECGGIPITGVSGCNNTRVYFVNTSYTATQRSTISCQCNRPINDIGYAATSNYEGRTICERYCVNCNSFSGSPYNCNYGTCTVPTNIKVLSTDPSPFPCQWNATGGRCKNNMCNNRGKYIGAGKCICSDPQTWGGDACDVLKCGVFGYVGHRDDNCVCNTTKNPDVIPDLDQSHPTYGSCVLPCKNHGIYYINETTCRCPATASGNLCVNDQCPTQFQPTTPYSSCNCSNVPQLGGTFCNASSCVKGYLVTSRDVTHNFPIYTCSCYNWFNDGGICQQQQCGRGYPVDPNANITTCACDLGYKKDSTGKCTEPACDFGGTAVACTRFVTCKNNGFDYNCVCTGSGIVYNQTSNNCIINTCSNKGSSHVNPLTGLRYCLCDHTYYGDNCEFKQPDNNSNTTGLPAGTCPSAIKKERLASDCSCKFPFSGPSCTDFKSECGQVSNAEPIYSASTDSFSCSCPEDYITHHLSGCIHYCIPPRVLDPSDDSCVCSNTTLTGPFCTLPGDSTGDSPYTSPVHHKTTAIIIGSVLGSVAFIAASFLGFRVYRKLNPKSYQPVSTK